MEGFRIGAIMRQCFADHKDETELAFRFMINGDALGLTAA